jgi:hypothetical protein
MSKRFANLSERLSADLPEDPTRPDMGDEDNSTADQEEGKKKKEKPMAETTPVEQTDDYKAGVTAERARCQAVFGSECYAGREATAHKLLGKDMTAADIIDVLADTPKVEKIGLTEEEKKSAEEEGARKAMLEAQSGDKNSSLEDGEGSKINSEKSSADVWDTAIARVFPKSAK